MATARVKIPRIHAIRNLWGFINLFCDIVFAESGMMIIRFQQPLRVRGAAWRFPAGACDEEGSLARAGRAREQARQAPSGRDTWKDTRGSRRRPSQEDSSRARRRHLPNAKGGSKR